MNIYKTSTSFPLVIFSIQNITNIISNNTCLNMGGQTAACKPNQYFTLTNFIYFWFKKKKTSVSIKEIIRGLNIVEVV